MGFNRSFRGGAVQSAYYYRCSTKDGVELGHYGRSNIRSVRNDIAQRAIPTSTRLPGRSCALAIARLVLVARRRPAAGGGREGKRPLWPARTP
jgi:hypothetical protein